MQEILMVPKQVLFLYKNFYFMSLVLRVKFATFSVVAWDCKLIFSLNEVYFVCQSLSVFGIDNKVSKYPIQTAIYSSISNTVCMNVNWTPWFKSHLKDAVFLTR